MHAGTTVLVAIGSRLRLVGLLNHKNHVRSIKCHSATDCLSLRQLTWKLR